MWGMSSSQVGIDPGNLERKGLPDHLSSGSGSETAIETETGSGAQ